MYPPFCHIANVALDHDPKKVKSETGPLPRMTRMENMANNNDFVMVADIVVTEVEPGRTMLQMRGSGADNSDYRMELHLEVPTDRTTRAVLGEILAQSELRVWRSVKSPIKARRLKRAKAGSNT